MRLMFAAIILAAFPVAAALADDYSNCAQDANPAVKFEGCSALLAKNPGLAAAYSSRGSASAALGNADQAIADYSYALVLDPSLGAAYYNRALLYLAEDNATLAADDFGQVIALDPKDATAYNGRGMAYAASSRFSLADADFAKALGLDPRYVRAYLGRANLNMLRGEFAAAAAGYEKVLQLDPGNADALGGRALAANPASPVAVAPAAPENDAVSSLTPLAVTPSQNRLPAHKAVPQGVPSATVRSEPKRRKSSLPAKTVSIQPAAGGCGTYGDELCIVLSR